MRSPLVIGPVHASLADWVEGTVYVENRARNDRINPRIRALQQNIRLAESLGATLCGSRPRACLMASSRCPA
jgi:hypothetical protein